MQMRFNVKSPLLSHWKHSNMTTSWLQTWKGTCKIKPQSFWINIFLHFLSFGSWCLLENSLSHWQHSNLIRRLTTNRVWLIKTELATPNKPGSRTEIGISWYPPMNSSTVLCSAATHSQILGKSIYPYKVKHCTVLVLDVALISCKFWVLNLKRCIGLGLSSHPIGLQTI